MLTIYTYPKGPRAGKAAITAKYAGVEYQVAPWEHGVTNQTPEFKAKFSTGMVPAMDTPDGPLQESNALARYVASLRPALHLRGTTIYDQALVEQWIDYSTSHIETPLNQWAAMYAGFVPYNKNEVKKQKEMAMKGLKHLDKHLETRTFIVSERVTIADIIAACNLWFGFAKVVVPAMRGELVNVTRWYTTMLNQPAFIEWFGEPVLCEKQPQPPRPAKQEKKKKEGKPAKAAEAPKPKPAKKAKHPLDCMPPSTLDLEEWKRFYSNTDETKAVAMPWFYERFETAGWSLFRCDYKDNEDFKVEFMAANLMGGMIQRCEAVRKWAFANLVLLKPADCPHFVGTGVFLFRGTDVPEDMKNGVDYESWDWKRLDVADAADKAFLEDVWAWEGDFGGLMPAGSEACEGKTLK